MIKQRRLIQAPYRVDYLFQIAQDVENYHHFLPHCVAARILDKSLAKWRVENLYRWGPASYKFITYADVQPNLRIHIQSDPHEKVQLDILWEFEEKDDQTSDIIFEMIFSTRIPLLEKLVAGLFPQMVKKTEQAFLKRGF